MDSLKPQLTILIFFLFEMIEGMTGSQLQISNSDQNSQTTTEKLTAFCGQYPSGALSLFFLPQLFEFT